MNKTTIQERWVQDVAEVIDLFRVAGQRAALARQAKREADARAIETWVATSMALEADQRKRERAQHAYDSAYKHAARLNALA